MAREIPELHHVSSILFLLDRGKWTEEAGGLQSTGSQRVGHPWATIIFTFHAELTDPIPKAILKGN